LLRMPIRPSAVATHGMNTGLDLNEERIAGQSPGPGPRGAEINYSPKEP
jgi:hypothetical protein